jgi:hypothetical protein
MKELAESIKASAAEADRRLRVGFAGGRGDE